MAVLSPTSSRLDLTISIPGSSGESVEDRAMRNLDMNRVPVEGGNDRGWMAMSMNRNYNNNSSAAELEDQDDDGNSNGGGGEKSPPRKKLRLSKEQSRLLEDSFRRNHTLNPKQKEALAMQLKLRPRQVEVWFQNRRARSKLKQTEMDCAYLKRWLGSLTKQNRRLQKEVEELRALKVGPGAVRSPHGCETPTASTVTMCPRCKRITNTAGGRAAAASAVGMTAAAAKLPAAIRNMLPMTRQPSSAAC